MEIRGLIAISLQCLFPVGSPVVYLPFDLLAVPQRRVQFPMQKGLAAHIAVWGHEPKRAGVNPALAVDFLRCVVRDYQGGRYKGSANLQRSYCPASVLFFLSAALSKLIVPVNRQSNHRRWVPNLPK